MKMSPKLTAGAPARRREIDIVVAALIKSTFAFWYRVLRVRRRPHLARVRPRRRWAPARTLTWRGLHTGKNCRLQWPVDCNQDWASTTRKARVASPKHTTKLAHVNVTSFGQEGSEDKVKEEAPGA